MFRYILARLNRFEVYANRAIFDRIFGQNSPRLWDSFFKECNQNSVIFYARLNERNQILLAQYLERYTKDC